MKKTLLKIFLLSIFFIFAGVFFMPGGSASAEGVRVYSETGYDGYSLDVTNGNASLGDDLMYVRATEHATSPTTYTYFYWAGNVKSIRIEGLYKVTVYYNTTYGVGSLVFYTSEYGGALQHTDYDPPNYNNCNNLEQYVMMKDAYRRTYWDCNVFSVKVERDTASPTIAISNPSPAYSNNASVTVTASATDSVGDLRSGVNESSWQYSTGGGQWYSGKQVNISSQGATYVSFKVRDYAGNEAQATTCVYLDRTGPAISISNPSILNGGPAWKTSTIRISASATDAYTAVNGNTWYYRIGDGAWKPGSYVDISDDLKTKVSFKVSDTLGNECLPVSTDVYFDRTQPTITLSNPCSVNGNLMWKRSAVQVSASAADPYSGVNEDSWQYRINGGDWKTGKCADVTTDGMTTVSFKVKDIAGNEAQIQTSVGIDRAKPSITVEPHNGWENTEQTSVKVTAEDSLSGLDQTSWQVKMGDGDWQSGNPFIKDGFFVFNLKDGVTEVSFKVKDNAGNEVQTVRTVYMDRSGPCISIVNPCTNWKNYDETTVSASAEDPFSGVDTASWQVQVGDGAWNAGNEVTVSDIGETRVNFRVKDNIGNWSLPIGTVVKIDRTAPRVTLTGNSPSWTKASPVTVKASATDDLSGLDLSSCQYRIGDNEWKTGSQADIYGEGETAVTFRVSDIAGNMSSEVGAKVKIDSSGPSISFIGSIEEVDSSGSKINVDYAIGSYTNASGVTVTASAGDWYSGLDEKTWKYCINDGAWQSGNVAAVTSEGNTKVTFSVDDLVGNNSKKDVMIRIDRTAPEINISNPYENWNNAASADISASAKDAGSGVKSVIVDGTTVSSTVVADEGETVVKFTATDNVDNVSTKETVVRLDRTKPTVPSIGFKLDNQDESPFIKTGKFITGDSVTLFAAAQDTITSNMKGRIQKYKVLVKPFSDPAPNFGKALESVNGIINIGGLVNGKNYIYVRAVDMAGNESDTRLGMVLVDKENPEAPSITSRTHPEAVEASDAVADKNPVFFINADMGSLSGIKEYKYELYKGSNLFSELKSSASGQVSFSDLPDNDKDEFYELRAWTVSNNTLTSLQYASYKFRIDSEPPRELAARSKTHSVQSRWYSNTKATFSWSMPLDFTGIKSYYYKFSDKPITSEDKAGRTATVLNEVSTDLKQVLKTNSGVVYFGLWAEDFSGNEQFYTREARYDIENPSIESVDAAKDDSSLSATLTWSAPTDNVEIQGVWVNLSTVGTGGEENGWIPLGKSLNTYTFEGLTENVTYIARVKVTDTAGNERIYSRAFAMGAGSVLEDVAMPFDQTISGYTVKGNTFIDPEKNEACLYLPEGIDFIKVGNAPTGKIKLDRGRVFDSGIFVSGSSSIVYSAVISGFEFQGKGISIYEGEGLVLDQISRNVEIAPGVMKTFTYQKVKVSSPPWIDFAEAFKADTEVFDFVSSFEKDGQKKSGFTFLKAGATGFEGGNWVIYDAKVDLTGIGAYADQAGVKGAVISVPSAVISKQGVLERADLTGNLLLEMGGNVYNVKNAILQGNKLYIFDAEISIGSGKLTLKNFSVSVDGTASREAGFGYSFEGINTEDFILAVSNLDFDGQKLIAAGSIKSGKESQINFSGLSIDSGKLSFNKGEASQSANVVFSPASSDFVRSTTEALDTLSIDMLRRTFDAGFKREGSEKERKIFTYYKLEDWAVSFSKNAGKPLETRINGNIVLPENFPGSLQSLEVPIQSFELDVDAQITDFSAYMDIVDGFFSGAIGLKEGTLLSIYDKDAGLSFRIDGILVLPQAMPGDLAGTEVTMDSIVINGEGNFDRSIISEITLPYSMRYEGATSIKNGEAKLVVSDDGIEIPILGNVGLSQSFPGSLGGTKLNIEKMVYDQDGFLKEVEGSGDLSYVTELPGEIKLVDGKVNAVLSQDNGVEYAIDGTLMLPDRALGILSGMKIKSGQLVVDSDGNIKEANAYAAIEGENPFIGKSLLRDANLQVNAGDDGKLQVNVSGNILLPGNDDGTEPSIELRIVSLIFDENLNMVNFEAGMVSAGDVQLMDNAVFRDIQIFTRKSGTSPWNVEICGKMMIPLEDDRTIEVNLGEFFFDSDGNVKKLDVSALLKGDTGLFGGLKLRDSGLKLIKESQDAPMEADISGRIILPAMELEGLSGCEVPLNQLRIGMDGSIKKLDAGVLFPGEKQLTAGIRLKDSSLRIAKDFTDGSLVFTVGGKILLPAGAPGALSSAEADIGELSFDENGNVLKFTSSLSMPGEKNFIGGIRLKDATVSVIKSNPAEPVIFSISGKVILPSNAPGVLANAEADIKELTLDSNGNVLKFVTTLSIPGENAFLGDTKIRDAQISVNKLNPEDPLEFNVSGNLLLPANAPGILSRTELEIQTFKLSADGTIKSLYASLDMPGEKQLVKGLAIRDAKVSVNGSEGSAAVIDVKGAVILGDQFPDGLKGLVLNIGTFTMDTNGQIKNLNIGLADINAMLFGKIQLIDGIISAAKGQTSSEFLFNVSGDIVLPQEMSGGLGGKRISIRKFVISTASGIKEFYVSNDMRIEFDLFAGIKGGFDQIEVSSTGIGIKGDLTFPYTFPEGLARKVITLDSLKMGWDGKIQEISAGIQSTTIHLGGFNIAVGGLKFRTDGISMASCELKLPDTLGNQKLIFQNAGFNTDGNFYGSVGNEKIEQDIAGFLLIINKPSLDIQNQKISFLSAQLKTPAVVGGAVLGINGVGISPSGVSFTGGKFRLPNFQMGGLGFRDTYVDFVLSGSSYSIEGAGGMFIPGAGLLSADISFVDVSNMYPYGVKRAEFRYRASGLGLPIGSTGLYMNEISGGIAFGPPDEIPAQIRGMFDNGARVKLGIGVQDGTGGNVLRGNATVWLDITDIDWAFQGDISILRGAANGEVIAALTQKGFYGNVKVELQFVRGQVSVYVFNYYGSTKVNGWGNVDFGIPKGEILHVRKTIKVFGHTIGTIKIDIPSSDWWIARIGAEMGTFRNGKEGFKGYVDVPILGNVGVFVSSSGSFSFTNLSSYDLIKPYAAAPMRYAAARSSQEESKFIPFDEISKERVTDTYQFNVSGGTNAPQAMSSMRALAAEPEAASNNVERIIFVVGYLEGDPQVKAISPSGKRYTKDDPNVEVAYESWGMMFAVKNPEVGSWQLEVGNMMGESSYDVQVLGKTAVPTLNLTSPKYEKQPVGENITISGNASGVKEGTTVTLFAANEKGIFLGRELGKTGTNADGSFVLNASSAALDSGEYYIYASLSCEGENPDVKVFAQGSILVKQESKLKPVQNLVAAEDGAGNLDIKFDDVNGDRAKGFYLYVESGKKGTEEKILLGYITSFNMPGFEHGDTLKVRIAAYDGKKNEGESCPPVSIVLGQEKQVINAFTLDKQEIPVNLTLGEYTQASIRVINIEPKETGSAYDYVVTEVGQIPLGVNVKFNKPAVKITGEPSNLEFTVSATDQALPGEYLIRVFVENMANKEVKKEFTIKALVKYPAIEVGSISPASWNNKEAATIEINGRNFFNGTKVFLGELELPIQEISNTLIKVEAPKGVSPSQGILTVVGPDGDKVEKEIEVLKPDYQIMGYKTNGYLAPGQTETYYIGIKGMNDFEDTIGFEVGEKPDNFEVSLDKNTLSDGEMMAVSVSVPQDAVPGLSTVMLKTSTGEDIELQVNVSSGEVKPYISSLSKLSAYEGETVYIYGGGFGEGITAKLGDKTLAVTEVGRNRIGVIVPENVSSGEVTVQLADNTSNAQYLYVKRKNFHIYPESETMVLTPGETATAAINVKGNEETVDLSCKSDNSDIVVTLDQTSIIPNGEVKATIKIGENLAKGVYHVTIQGKGESGTDTRIIEITLPEPLSIKAESLADAQVDTGYKANIQAENAIGEVRFNIKEGALPLGLTLKDNGSIEGTPRVMGDGKFTVRAVDGKGREAACEFKIHVTQNLWFSDKKDGGNTRYSPSKSPCDNSTQWSSEKLTGAKRFVTGSSKVYVLTDSGMAAIDKATGNTLYKKEGAFKDIAYGGMNVYLFNSQGVLEAIESETGTAKWKAEGVSSFTTDGGRVIAAVADGYNEFDTSTGDVTAHIAQSDMEEGNFVWRGSNLFKTVGKYIYSIAETSVQKVFEAEDVIQEAASDGKDMVLLYKNGKLVVLDEQFNVIGQVQSGIVDGKLGLTDDRIILSGMSSTCAYSRSELKKIFENSLSTNEVALAKEKIFTAGGTGMTCINGFDGNPIWSVEGTGVYVGISGERVYVLYADGRLVCYNGPDNMSPPATSILLDPAQPNGNNSYYKKPVTVTLEAKDRESKAAATYYKISKLDGTGMTDYVPYKGAFSLQEGEYEVTAYSVDTWGYREPDVTRTVKTDLTAPSTQIEISGPKANSEYYMPGVRVCLTARDNLSSLAYIEYSINNGGWVKYSQEFVLTPTGVCTISYRAVDNAGNIEEIRQAVVKVAFIWKPDTSYKSGDLVAYNGLAYRCRQSHTTQLGWEPPNVPALWEREVEQPTGSVTEWQVNVQWKTRTLVSYKGKIYQCIQAHMSFSNYTPDVTPALWKLIQ